MKAAFWHIYSALSCMLFRYLKEKPKQKSRLLPLQFLSVSFTWFHSKEIELCWFPYLFTLTDQKKKKCNNNNNNNTSNNKYKLACHISFSCKPGFLFNCFSYTLWKDARRCDVTYFQLCFLFTHDSNDNEVHSWMGDPTKCSSLGVQFSNERL